MPVITLQDSKDVHEYIRRVYDELNRCAIFLVACAADQRSYYLIPEKYAFFYCEWCSNMAQIVVAEQEQIVCAHCYERYVCEV